ncbi:hypothetical protein MHZ90_18125 [Pantoea sp. ACRSH]|uniref:hypothetical protein n=1 Tax=unclassified Pantoea TaxID=2630326 RepID=UPI001EF59FD8|nr:MULTISPECIES: hypothetical protein [unclassified Pantoea]MCG7368030.1 hypothetical protein [Pantoea sp. ACRSH]MCG7398389.1 hypothetical protein [Pantoea sp. ACRSC]
MSVIIKGLYVKVLHPSNSMAHFEVLLSNCNTPEAIKHWASHLLEKSWVSRQVADRFISLMATRIGADRNDCLPTELIPITPSQRVYLAEKIAMLRAVLKSPGAAS